MSALPTLAACAGLPDDAGLTDADIAFMKGGAISPEDALFRAILTRALEDAASSASACGDVRPEDRDEARRWLLSPLQPWKSDREAIALAAGVEPDFLARYARKIIAARIEIERAAEAQHVESEEEQRKRLAALSIVERGRSFRGQISWRLREAMKHNPVKPGGPRFSAAEIAERRRWSAEEVLPGGTAFITDVGMTGPHDSVIGMEKQGILQHFLDAMPSRFVVAEGDVQMNTVLIDVDESTGRARSIERLNFRLD